MRAISRHSREATRALTTSGGNPLARTAAARTAARAAARTAALWALLLLAVLTGGCSGDADGLKGPVLNIYVYTPEAPIATRADIGDVSASEAEAKVNTLQVWVFKHADGSLVGYLGSSETASVLDQAERGTSAVFQVEVSESFVLSPENVDVYVVANSPITLGESTTRAELDGVLVSAEDWAADLVGKPQGTNGGLPAVMTAVPAGGLPMSGVLKDAPVTGNAPVLRVGTDGAMATVTLARTVSKVRFVFCRTSGTEATNVSIDKITLDGKPVGEGQGLVPDAEYLFLNEAYNRTNSHISTTYLDAETTLLSEEVASATPLLLNIPEQEFPADFSYPVYSATATGRAQAYETFIDQSVAEEKLAQAGIYYLRETDKLLTGRIEYSVTYSEGSSMGTGTEQKTATFAMQSVGDFTRNHSWIVYAFYGSASIEVYTVQVADYVEKGPSSHAVYNW